MKRSVKHSKIIPAFSLLALLWVISPGCADLDVENLNDPDTERVLQDSEDILSVAGGIFQIWHNNVQSYNLSIMLSSLADQTTTNWDNGGWRPMVGETRIPWNNNKSYDHSDTTLDRWSNLYQVISLSNDILKRINEGLRVKDSQGNDVTEMVKAMCYYCLGISYGYTACIFDKGFVLGPVTDLASLESISFDVMIDSAINFLDLSIEICDNTQFTLPANWINGQEYSNLELMMMSNSYAARFLASNSRNKEQDESADWPRILNYAKEGIVFDLDIYIDNNYWTSWYARMAWDVGWTMVDLRIIKLMDPDYPRVWPADNQSWDTPDGQHPGPASSPDARIDSLFEYMEVVPLQPGKGYEYFSNYRWKKFDHIPANARKGKLPIFYLVENDLLLAEALIKANNDYAAAIEIINSGTRVNNGKLTPLSPDATKEEILNAIFYEKDIELCYSGLGISFFDMRRRNMLQQGSLLHFPVPGQELWSLDLNNYTYGGTVGKPGEDYSNGGW